MNVALFLEGTQHISPFYIEGFSFISDIHSFHTKSKLFLKNIDQTFEKIKVGTEIFVLFFDDDNNLYFNNPMSVISFKRHPGPDVSAQDILEITLIHSSFFKDYSKTYAYGVSSNYNSGATIKAIASNIFNKEFTEYFESVNDVQETEDYPSIRYQINEKNSDFLIRISKYAYKQNLPVYVFSDPKNFLHLSCISNSINNEPSYCLFPEDSPKEILSKESLKNLKKISIKNYKINVNSETSHYSIDNKFTADNFIMDDPASKTLKTLKSPLRISGNQRGNAHLKQVLPSKTIIRGWNLTPSDARAISIREGFETNNSLYMLEVDVPGIKLELTSPNTLVRVAFPEKVCLDTSTGKYLNLGDGDYLIYHSLIGYKNNMWFTHLKLYGINLKLIE